MSDDFVTEDVELIAIVGMACRFPGASDIDSYWQNLKNGVESITTFSDNELMAAGVDKNTCADPLYVKARGRLENHDFFDAAFFGFTPSEAAVTDPQHRIFLECAWEAMEHAGYDPQKSGEGTGVYAGAGLNTYALRNLMADPELLSKEGEYRILIGNDKDFVATRTSYKLDLTGPSLNISTACSTSLVAIHYACSGLLTYQCDMAIAGAVSIYTPQDQGYMHEPGGILSADGHCRPFSAEAGGTVGSAGVGIVVLKRLSDALADGDTIHAVIRGTAVNNDGADKVGFTAPSVEGQARVIIEAQDMADVTPETIGFVEAHGTGTSLGDPIELAALTRAFSRNGVIGERCYLGSVKSNFGHCDAAAGMAGLIKTVLALKNKAIPPTLHCNRTHPEIDFANSPFHVNTELKRWDAGKTLRRAGVSSFGVGGTNAHVILEEYPLPEPLPDSDRCYLLPISAKTGAALENCSVQLYGFLATQPTVNLADTAFTLQVGRSHFRYRRAIVCHDRESAIAGLQGSDLSVNTLKRSGHGRNKVAFLFSGQGTQHEGMGLYLYLNEPIFRSEVDRCAEILLPLMGQDIRHLLYADKPGSDNAMLSWQETALAQPALFVVEYALAGFLIAIGVQPAACIGHSLGEYVAACIAGVFSLEDALKIVVARGRLMQEMKRGAMVAVAAKPDDLPAECLEGVSIAAINTANSFVLSGSFQEIEHVEERLRELDIPAKRLHTSHAFHSEMMSPVIGRFIQQLESISFSTPQLPVISNVTGEWLRDEQATYPHYWAEHLLSTVRFADGMGTLFTEADYVTVEIGPGHTLASFARSHALCTRDHLVCTTLPSPQKARGDKGFTFTQCLADLWETGVNIEWPALHAGQRRQRIPLPTYPFERQQFVLKNTAGRVALPYTHTLDSQQDKADWFYRPSWKRGVVPSLQEEYANSHWLIFADQFGAGRKLGTILEHDGANVQYVDVTDSASHGNNDGYQLDPADKGAILRLLQKLDEKGTFPDGIVYCWSLVAQAQSLQESVDVNRVVFYDALILLAQALEQCKPAHSASIQVISSGMFEVIGNEWIDPAASLLMGPVTVIPQEHPNISCRVIDISGHEGMVDLNEQRCRMLAAMCRCRTVDAVTALRGSHYWKRTFEQVSYPAVTGKPPLIRQRGVYLIVGGMGGIGLNLAEYLARSGDVRLILVGRHASPAIEKTSKPEELKPRINKQLSETIEFERSRIEQNCSIQSIRQRGNLESQLNRLCTGLVVRYLNRLDINTSSGATYSINSLAEQCGVSPKFHRFFLFLLSVVGDIKPGETGNSVTFNELSVTEEEPSSLAAALAEEFPAFAPMIQFLEYCTANYPQALTSEAEAISVLYPQGDPTALKKIASEIEEHTFHRVYCMLLATEVEKYVAAAAGKLVRILEIGGGAGILTRHVMPLIAGQNVEYTFTDIGPSFVAEAKDWAAENGYDEMRFGTLDVSQDFLTQGYAAHDFDLIIELDVVHATPRIVTTMSNLKRMLAPGGMLLMAESTTTPRWTTMIYGLAEGWWLYEDTELRPDGPLLSPEKWESVLKQSGFDDVCAYPENGAMRREHDCCLVAGRVAGNFSADMASRPSGGGINTRLDRLMAMGAEVRTFAADISSKEQVEAVVKAAEDEFGTINGVIHSAAIENRGAIQLKETGVEGAEFAAKVSGTMVLDEVFRERSLDFMIICSSITSILGGVGDVEYTAVNAFADAFAEAKQNDTDRYTVSIDWDRWISTGMAEHFEKRFKTLSGSTPEGGMSAEEGMETFGRILSNLCNGQLVVSTRPFNDWIKEAQAGTSQTIADLVPEAVSMQTRPDLGSDYIAPVSDTQKMIATVWQEVLGIERIGLDDHYSEIGGDSLIAIKIVSRLNELFDVNINVRALFEDQTVAGVSERIEAIRAVDSTRQSVSANDTDMEETGTL